MLAIFFLWIILSVNADLLDDVFESSDIDYNVCGGFKRVGGDTTFIFKRPESGARNPPGRFPWTISIGEEMDSGEWEHQCGGVLVKEQLVLTAAHCALDLDRDIKKGQTKVRAGDDNLRSDEDDDGVQVINVAKYETHPDYNGLSRTSYYDIALLILEKPMVLSETVRIICLPMPTENDFRLPLTTTGWGLDFLDRKGHNLSDTSLQVYSESYCNETHIGQSRFEHAVPMGFTSDLFCGGDQRNSGTCHGDSGSPAVFQENPKAMFVLKGVVTGGLSCGTLKHPNIYVRVSDQKVLSWIKSELSREFVPITTVSSDCSCINFRDNDGFGQCKRNDFFNFDGAAPCYLQLPSNCTDRVESRTHPGKWISAEACTREAINKFHKGCVSDVKLEEKCLCSGFICKPNHICVDGKICIPDIENPNCGTRIFKDLPEDQSSSKNPPGSWPWVLSLGEHSVDSVWEHTCGAVLVTPSSALTAASCIARLKIKSGELYIRAGDDHLQDDADDAGVQVIQVSDFFIHPDFKRGANYADIALLKLATPARLTDVVRTICLPPTPTLRDEDKGLALTVTGWGANDEGVIGEELRDYFAQVYNEEFCNLTHHGEKHAKLAVPLGFTSDLLCAGSTNGDGACHGDGGNPAGFFQFHFILKGIVSGGLSCGTAEHPNIYTRIGDKKILNWIRLQIWETSGPICTTTSVNEKGGRTNASCVFPFIYKGETYRECAYHGKLEDYWCSTKVDEEGTHISGQQQWGFCGPECPYETL